MSMQAARPGALLAAAAVWVIVNAFIIGEIGK